jgi:hypothetical protein
LELTKHSSLAETRAGARKQAATLLGADELTPPVLLGLAEQLIGDSRARRLMALVRGSQLTRRADALACLAALVVGTRELGPVWWSEAGDELRPDGTWRPRGKPDAVLADGDNEALRRLASWIEDAAADAAFGRPIDYVDLNDPRADDRVRLPADAEPGRRYVAAFEPGGRVQVEAVARNDDPPLGSEASGTRRGRLGSRLGSTMSHATAETEWAWSMATDTGPVELPDELDNERPFAAPLDQRVAERLAAWATKHGASSADLGTPWMTKADLWIARFRLGLPYERSGAWFPFDRAVRAVVDGEPDAAAMVASLG